MASEEPNPWEIAQQRLRNVLDEHSYKNWFSQTRLQSCDNGTVVIGVPSRFFAEWLRDHYLETVTECLQDVVPDFEEVRFEPISETGDTPTEQGAAAPKTKTSTAAPPRQAPSAPSHSSGEDSRETHGAKRGVFEGFNARYSFEHFVVGAGNRFAHAAAKAVAESPARAYNPLFLYGRTGLGKTHLMQAIGQEVLRKRPDANIAYVSSEQFTNQLIESIARKSTQRFRNKYRKADILLIDDIHFIAGKEATQEEFFHTFNALFDMHKQIVLSSDRQPKDIKGVEERLISRFEWGLVTDIQPPDLETRVAILQNKAIQENATIPKDVPQFIARHITNNIRELEGALITVIAYSKLTQRDITQKLVEEVLRDLIGRETIKPITIDAVQRAVAEHFDVRISDLRGSSRQRQVAFPRQIAMYLCKELIPSLSLNEVGEAFGGRDHTTVLYACQRITKEIKNNSTTRQLTEKLEKGLRP
ncbi:MAG: chromosomal replication initiator protein DnaA [Candidatus Hydrogenedentota bacterium]